MLYLQERENNMVWLSSGHCCVMTVVKVVPVELLTGILHQVFMQHNGDVNSIIDSFDWGDDFKLQLKQKVKDYNIE